MNDPEHPSPDAAKITESLVLVEFVADIAPKSGLMPSDPVDRARARFFIDTVSTKTVPGFFSFVMKGEAPDALYAGLQAIQELLPKEGGFALGGSQFTVADAAVAPFLGRTDLLLRNEYGKYTLGEGNKVHKEIFEGEKFARLQQYFKDITARDSWKQTFFPVSSLIDLNDCYH